MQAGTFEGIPWLASNAVAYPLLEVVHIVGIGLLLGNLVLVELRVWGRGAELPIAPLGRLALTIAVAGFGLAALSGVAMLAANPAEVLANRAFRIKLVLLGAAGSNALLFHVRGGLAKTDGAAKVQTALSLLLWLGVVVCGRWIAYR